MMARRGTRNVSRYVVGPVAELSRMTTHCANSGACTMCAHALVGVSVLRVTAA
jgi:hypothetical protein